jgi:lysophospholipase L1-like esterase
MRTATSLLRRVLAHAALVAFGISAALVLGEVAARLTWRPTPPPVAARHPQFRRNSLGIRGPEYSLRPPSGVFRILVVGDSVTAGANVEERDAYPAQLEAALAAREAPPRYEVLNAGVPGLDIRHIVDRLETVGLRYDPDLIITAGP